MKPGAIGNFHNLNTPMGMFVATSNLTASNNHILTSAIGNSWNLSSVTDNNSWNGICYAPELNLFCAVASTGTNRVMTSSNGVNWIGHTASENNDWQRVTWSPKLGLFCAVAHSGTHKVMTSPNGSNWTSTGCTISISSGSPTSGLSVVWTPELEIFLISARMDAGSGGQTTISISSDGINWTNRINSGTSTKGANIKCCWSPDLRIFVLIGQAGTNSIFTSPDGINWAPRTAAITNIAVDVTWSHDLKIFCIVSYTTTGSNTQISSDGIKWVAYDNGIHPSGWVTLKESFTVIWSSEVKCFVVANSVTDDVSISPDGINWSTISIPQLQTSSNFLYSFNDITSTTYSQAWELDNSTITPSSGYASASGGNHFLADSNQGSGTQSLIISTSTPIALSTYSNMQWGGYKESGFPPVIFEMSNNGGTSYKQISFSDVATNSTWELINQLTVATSSGSLSYFKWSFLSNILYTQDFGTSSVPIAPGWSFTTDMAPSNTLEYYVPPCDVAGSSQESILGFQNGSGGSDESVSYGPINGVGRTNLKISWNSYRQAGTMLMNFAWSTNGSSWNNITFTDNIEDYTWRPVVVSLSAADNTNFYIQWSYTSDAGYSNLYTMFDDVKVYSDVVSTKYAIDDFSSNISTSQNHKITNVVWASKVDPR